MSLNWSPVCPRTWRSRPSQQRMGSWAIIPLGQQIQLSVCVLIQRGKESTPDWANRVASKSPCLSVTPVDVALSPKNCKASRLLIWGNKYTYVYLLGKEADATISPSATRRASQTCVSEPAQNAQCPTPTHSPCSASLARVFAAKRCGCCCFRMLTHW